MAERQDENPRGYTARDKFRNFRQRVWRVAKYVFDLLLLYKYRQVAYVTITIVSVFAISVAGWNLLTESEPISIEGPKPAKLDLDVIDKLELLVETRQGAYETLPVISSVGVFR